MCIKMGLRLTAKLNIIDLTKQLYNYDAFYYVILGAST